jgi:hypothetical protein
MKKNHLQNQVVRKPFTYLSAHLVSLAFMMPPECLCPLAESDPGACKGHAFVAFALIGLIEPPTALPGEAEGEGPALLAAEGLKAAYAKWVPGVGVPSGVDGSGGQD